MRPVDADALMAKLNRKKAGPANQRYTEGFNDCLMRVRSMVHSAPTLTPPNEPMTLEQLREMDGEPVYLIVDDGYEPLEMWALIDVPEEDHIVLINNIGGRSAYYSDDGLKQDHITVYRRPPEGEI